MATNTLPAWITCGINTAERATTAAIPDQYPRTYAIDYLRGHAAGFGIPTAATRDRGTAATWLRRRLGITNPDDRSPAYTAVLAALADAYLRERRMHIDDTTRTARLTKDATPR
ncbi:hypothetical protein ACFWYW_46875 [Nonomuraea sp. NPDC059023]|uniref:hypothetical protein n=1 Tax=unclassified Nonomuraea TaxID=2593643 RepID=UPI0036CD1741